MAQKLPVFWVSGNLYECRKHWHSVINKLSDVNVVTIEAGHNTETCPANLRYWQSAQISNLIRTKDLFDTRPRIVRLLGIPPDYKELSSCLKYISSKNQLYIDSPIGYYKPSGTGIKLISAATSSFAKEIKSKGHFIQYTEDAKTEITILCSS